MALVSPAQLFQIRPDELQLTQSLGQDVPEEAQKEQLAAAADEANKPLCVARAISLHAHSAIDLDTERFGSVGQGKLGNAKPAQAVL
ncbi:unnamed protein product [Symbiodinium sp. KB8]|nr:unnamed protein product [Symbiodinium sp. KB8]